MSRSGYDVYIGKCLLPVAPEKIQVKIKNQNKTLNLINEGEVNILKNAGLTEAEFEFIVPQVRYPFAVYKSGFKDASYYLNFLEKTKKGHKKVQFIICRRTVGGKGLFNTNLKVSVEDWAITDDVKEGYDLTVKVKLKQWRNYGTKTVTIKQPELESVIAQMEPDRESDNSPAPTTQPLTYTVQKGDCLWKIAKQFYGNGSAYNVIFNANSNQISNPNLIYPGQVLVIPTV
ncbi:peptidoglycan-binding protein LysM [Oribacterium sp. C9]|uniref:LysM peptidoglycan-binding domain-containing protein n=1 Tax=Oribacterium sp. C9 TaxID=1943579 RepID=UPI00098F743E|nr:LysM peptidoglycan-binding domain-containing protein [Oribacterium sp. C9]OON85924.1 peptidoglycan-binding protein LysM [Oribacterium sp. C9]